MNLSLKQTKGVVHKKPKLSIKSSSNVMTLCIDNSNYTHTNNLIIENGDLVPEWAYFWLDIGRRLKYAYGEVFAPLIHIPSRKYIYEIEIDVLCAEIYSSGWRTYNDFFIVLNAHGINKKKICCEGIIYPVYDGMGITIEYSSLISDQINNLLNEISYLNIMGASGTPPQE